MTAGKVFIRTGVELISTSSGISEAGRLVN